MDATKYAALFLSDSREHLQQCDTLLLTWEGAPSQTEPVAGLFRAMHTIKGMAATMGYSRLAELTHEAEHLLDGVRGGRIAPTAELVSLMFEVVDAIGSGVEDAVAGMDGEHLDESLRGRLSEFAGVGSGGAPDGGAAPSAAAPVELASPAAAGSGRWVTVTIRAGVVMGWARALLALRSAEEFGAVTGVTPDPGTVDPDRFGGKLAFRLDSPEPADLIRSALLSVGDVADVIVEEGARKGAAAGTRVRREVRVGREHLDRLMANVGELMVARNQLTGLVDHRRDPALEEAVARLARMTDQVHEGILQARMAPIAEIFDRFPRAIRDLAREVGKQVRLEVQGREIEVDRAVLELIQDPLLHLLRNAVDHGLEDAATRQEAGKPAEGVIRLEAQRQRDGIVIAVSDDGRGIDRERVRQRLGAAGDAGDLDDTALLAVLARPGFSTAREVTAVSGRGVGIDVVLTRIREIGGAVSLRSVVGQGATFTIRLPQTLAVVPTVLADAGSERYAIPLARIQETGRARPQPAGTGGGQRVAFRGEELPALDLRRAVGSAGEAIDAVRPFLVVAVGERRGVIVVDTLLGRQDLVVSSVELPVGAPRWITGAAVLPDGVPAFLLDPGGLFQEESAWQM